MPGTTGRRLGRLLAATCAFFAIALLILTRKEN